MGTVSGPSQSGPKLVRKAAPPAKTAPVKTDPALDKTAIDFILTFRNSTPDQAKIIWKSVKTYSEKYGVNPLFVLCIIAKESSFRERAISSTMDVGLMQLSDGALAEVEKGLGRIDRKKVEDNILAGVYYLARKCKGTKGNEVYGLVSYHTGPKSDAGCAETLSKRPKVALYVCNICSAFEELKNGRYLTAASNISKKYSSVEVAAFIDLAKKRRKEA